jgi:hypothetical protein
MSTSCFWRKRVKIDLQTVMQAKCVHNKGDELGPPQSWAFHSEQTPFDLEIGRDYHVFGVGLFRGVLAALVFEGGRAPNFLPVGLFDFTPQKLPDRWEFGVHDGKAASGVGEPESWVAMWGYPELVRDPRHAERLVDRDPEALGVFYLQLARVATDLLADVIEKRSPQMLDWPPQIGIRRLDAKEREELHRAIVEAMDAEGFFRSGDPTDRARELNDLLVYLPYL